MLMRLRQRKNGRGYIMRPCGWSGGATGTGRNL
nr:MAG TPA: hypothetical protein [Caudoviricetes sp.]